MICNIYRIIKELFNSLNPGRHIWLRIYMIPWIYLQFRAGCLSSWSMGFANGIHLQRNLIDARIASFVGISRKPQGDYEALSEPTQNHYLLYCPPGVRPTHPWSTKILESNSFRIFDFSAIRQFHLHHIEQMSYGSEIIPWGGGPKTNYDMEKKYFPCMNYTYVQYWFRPYPKYQWKGPKSVFAI